MNVGRTDTPAFVETARNGPCANLLALYTGICCLVHRFPRLIENRAARPPWGERISADITNLGNYLVSSTGRDVFELLEEAFLAAADEKTDAVIE
ncbi:MAG: Imm70 family immunity protein [Betaproteobacteria bacterium]